MHDRNKTVHDRSKTVRDRSKAVRDRSKTVRDKMCADFWRAKTLPARLNLPYVSSCSSTTLVLV